MKFKKKKKKKNEEHTQGWIEAGRDGSEVISTFIVGIGIEITITIQSIMSIVEGGPGSLRSKQIR